MQNQKNRILEWLYENKSITQLDAWRELGVARLTNRISELKQDGYKISTRRIKVKNRYDESCSIAEYYLEDVT
jgi:hypothetical protein